MGYGRFPLKFTLLWMANLAVVVAVYFIFDLDFPFLVNIRDVSTVLLGVALVMAGLETALISKIKGE